MSDCRRCGLPPAGNDPWNCQCGIWAAGCLRRRYPRGRKPRGPVRLNGARLAVRFAWIGQMMRTLYPEVRA